MTMTAMVSGPRPTWTWADLLSTWRFWALIGGYLMAVPLADAVLFQALPLLSESTGATMVEVSRMVAVRHLATAFGFCLAWPALRWKPVPALVLLAVAKAAGMALLGGVGGGSEGGRMVGAAVSGLSTGAIALLVPALLAGGRHGAEAFLVSFGTVSMGAVLVGIAANLAIGRHVDAFGTDGLGGALVLAAGAGAVLFAAVGRALFEGPPPVRGRALPPVTRHPVVTALLLFVPFYGLYWLYRIHGEVAALAPSRGLLSPRAAAFGAVFVPFLALAAVASLMDALNEAQHRAGQPRLRSAVTVFLWALCFMPVAVALVQAAANKVAAPRPA